MVIMVIMVQINHKIIYQKHYIKVLMKINKFLLNLNLHQLKKIVLILKILC